MKRRFSLLAVVAVVSALVGFPARAAIAPPARPVNVAPATTAAPAPLDPMLTSAVAAAAPGEEIVAIANFDRPATAAQIDTLRAAAGEAVGFRHLPMAAVMATPAELAKVRLVAGVRSLYWNEPQQFHTNESQAIIGASQAWDLGIHGEGVGIAILDTGVDGTHPDLVDHLAANVKILGPEYIRQAHGSFSDVLIDNTPTSDTTSGHGTHVAGDAAGDGTASGGKYKGPAYNADIIGIGTGEGLNIFTALSGFEYAITHQAERNIRVINNSWGTSFRLHDPNHPVVRASKAATDAGMSVVFSAGNSYEEMTISPYTAPWNISVAAGAKAGGLTSFSSRGVEFDNLPTIPADNPAAQDFTGTATPIGGLGLYHPSVTGVGENVVSARAPGTVVSALGFASGDESLTAEELPRYTHASGTSMSAPQTSGVVALAQQAFHRADSAGRWLTPAQAKSVLELSATPMVGLKLYQQGYGMISAPGVVQLAASLANLSATDIDSALATRRSPRDAQLAAQTDFNIISTNVWRRPTLDSVQNLAKLSFNVAVPAAADRVKAIVNFPSTPELNAASVDLYLFDASTPRKEIGRATASSFNVGVQKLDVDLTKLAFAPTFGSWLLEARGDISTSCFTTRCSPPADTWVLATVLDAKAPAPGSFSPTGTRTLNFHNESAGESGSPLVKPGYTWDNDRAGGSMAELAPDHPRAGFAGYAHNYAPGVGLPSVFTSDPLASALTVGQSLTLKMFLQGEGSAAGRGSIGYWLFEVLPNGDRRAVSSEELTTLFDYGPQPVANTKAFPLTLPYTFAAGSRIQLELKFSAAVSSGMRFYYDAPAEPAALVLTTGIIQ